MVSNASRVAARTRRVKRRALAMRLICTLCVSPAWLTSKKLMSVLRSAGLDTAFRMGTILAGAVVSRHMVEPGSCREACRRPVEARH